MDMTGVTTIGRCSGCGRMSVLEELACEGCNSRYRAGCGTVMARIRENPILARMCYDRLTSKAARDRFITMFGTPWVKEAT